MKLIIALCFSLLCLFSKAKNIPIAGRTFLFIEYDSSDIKINLFNTAIGGVYMMFQESNICYDVGNSYTSGFSQRGDSLYIKHPMGTLVAIGGFYGMLEHLMNEKIWKPESIKKLGYSYHNDSLILVNNIGEKWILVDSAAIQKSIENRKKNHLNPTLKEVFIVEGNSSKSYYIPSKKDTILVKNTWGKPYVYNSNYSQSYSINVQIDFDTLKLGEGVYNRIEVDDKRDLSISLFSNTDSNSYLSILNNFYYKTGPISDVLRFKYVNGQFEYHPFEHDKTESIFPISAKIDYLKKKKVNGKSYKNIYVFSYDLNENTEDKLLKKCYWAAGIGPIEIEFINGEKLFLINEDID